MFLNFHILKLKTIIICQDGLGTNAQQPGKVENKMVCVELLSAGKIYLKQPAIVRLKGRRNIVIEYNELHHGPYGGLLVGWMNPSLPTPSAIVFFARYNHVHDYGMGACGNAAFFAVPFSYYCMKEQELPRQARDTHTRQVDQNVFTAGILSDFGGIYMSSGDNRCFEHTPDTCSLGIEIYSNVIRDGSHYNYGCQGVCESTTSCSCSCQRGAQRDESPGCCCAAALCCANHVRLTVGLRCVYALHYH